MKITLEPKTDEFFQLDSRFQRSQQWRFLVSRLSLRGVLIYASRLPCNTYGAAPFKTWRFSDCNQ